MADMTDPAFAALAELRPHHPRAVVGQRYVMLAVSFDAWRAALAVLGDHDLGRFDLDAAAAAHGRDRENYYEDLGREETRKKWGGA